MSYSLHNSEVFRVLHTQIYPRYVGSSTRERRLRVRLEKNPGDWVTPSTLREMSRGTKLDPAIKRRPTNAGSLSFGFDLTKHRGF